MLSWQERRCLTSMSGGKNTRIHRMARTSASRPPHLSHPLLYNSRPWCHFLLFPVWTLHPARNLSSSSVLSERHADDCATVVKGSNHCNSLFGCSYQKLLNTSFTVPVKTLKLPYYDIDTTLFSFYKINNHLISSNLSLDSIPSFCLQPPASILSFISCYH